MVFKKNIVGGSVT